MKTRIPVWQLFIFFILVRIANPFVLVAKDNTGMRLILSIVAFYIIYQILYVHGARRKGRLVSWNTCLYAYPDDRNDTSLETHRKWRWRYPSWASTYGCVPKQWRGSTGNFLSAMYCIVIATNAIIGDNIHGGGLVRPYRYVVFTGFYGVVKESDGDGGEELTATHEMTSDPVLIDSSEYIMAKDRMLEDRKGESCDGLIKNKYYLEQAAGSGDSKSIVNVIKRLSFSVLDCIIQYIIFDVAVFMLIYFAMSKFKMTRKIASRFSRGLHWAILTSRYTINEKTGCETVRVPA